MRGSRDVVGSRSTLGAAVIAATVGCAIWAPVTASDPQSAPRTFAQPSLRPSAYPTEVATSPAPPVAPVAPVSPAVPVSPPKAEPSWPKTLPEVKAEAAPPKLDVYSDAEIAAARSQCKAQLKGLDVVVIDELPIKTGSCGTPAPVQLVSLGKSPQVALQPPVVVTCDMVAAMHKWVTQDVQPLARKHLGAQVVAIETMSSYSCRNAYGRKRTNLSEHGRANALDIRSFVTADAKETTVLTDWGPTGWEIRAQIAAANKAAKIAADKAAAEKLAAEKAAAAKTLQAGAPQPNGTKAAGAVTPAGSATTATGSIGIVDNLPTGIASRLPGAAASEEGKKGFGLIRPSNLGGPKTPAGKDQPAAAAAKVAPDSTTQSRKAQFLRDAHDTACKIFGTTLGPETNLAHKNHFHVDMAERARGNFCE